MSRGRRTFGPVVLAGLASAALAAVAGSKAWAAADVADSPEAALIGPALTSTGEMPAAGALGLVLLACWGVVLVTRGRVRRAVAVLGAAAAAGVLVAVVLGWSSTAEQVRRPLEQVGADASVSHTAWFWLSALSGVLSLLATGVAVRLAPSWPEMGGRYDAPAGGGDAAAGATPAAPDTSDEPSNLDLWKAMDEGRDPTA